MISKDDMTPLAKAAIAVASVAALSGLASCTTTGSDDMPDAFSGRWEGTYRSTTAFGTNGVECTDGRGGFTVADGSLAGSATNTYGQSYALVGRVVAGGRLEGTFELPGAVAGQFQGELSDGRIVGTFVDAEDCRGSWWAVRT